MILYFETNSTNCLKSNNCLKLNNQKHLFMFYIMETYTAETNNIYDICYLFLTPLYESYHRQKIDYLK